MKLDDILRQYGVYRLPNRRRVFAVRGEDGCWRLWEYEFKRYKSIGRTSFDQPTNFSWNEYDYYEVMSNGYIKKDGKVVLALNYLEDERKDFDVRTSRETQNNEQIDNWMSDFASMGPGPRMLEMPTDESDEE